MKSVEPDQRFENLEAILQWLKENLPKEDLSDLEKCKTEDINNLYNGVGGRVRLGLRLWSYSDEDLLAISGHPYVPETCDYILYKLQESLQADQKERSERLDWKTGLAALASAAFVGVLAQSSKSKKNNVKKEKQIKVEETHEV